MNENLLQYLWNFKILSSFDFKDTQGNTIEILDFGKWNQDKGGADFLMAKVKINDVVLVGHIEIHVKSSDWELHRHTGNPHFDNVILHVVYENDKSIAHLEQHNVATLELKNYLSSETIDLYETMMKKEQFIPCEELILPHHTPLFFSEENVLKKLDKKNEEILNDLKLFKNDYEAVLFHHIAYSFGLRVNAKLFKALVQNIDFKIVQKLSHHITSLEALFFGYADLIQGDEDEQSRVWKREFEFISKKFQLNQLRFRPQFFRLRPANFPSIRLAQLAQLYHQEHHLFSKMMKAKNISDMKSIFQPIKASTYWDNHYTFGKETNTTKEKKISNAFIDLLLINTILPIKYAYHKNTNAEIGDYILHFYEQLPAEKNSVVGNWKDLKVSIKSGLDSQAYIYQHKNFCASKKCLNCKIGFQILKNKNNERA